MEIGNQKGTGPAIQFAGTRYNIGGRSVTILRNSETILQLGEHCTVAGYPGSDAKAFAAL